MTYTDEYKFPASRIMDDDLAQLRDADDTEKPRLFVAYCRKAIAAKEAGRMPLRDAAYSIARTMFIKELDDPLFEELTGLAGELELPAEFVSGDQEVRWKQLVVLVDNYDKVLRSDAYLDKVEQKQANMERRTNEALEKYHDK